jgi:hypothetical protein
MAEMLPGQCDRCVFLKEWGGYRFFFCDARGYPMLAIYPDESRQLDPARNRVDHDRRAMVHSCACANCTRALALAYYRGLISKTAMDEAAKASIPLAKAVADRRFLDG